jgi:outer membrane protein assembly factor BamD (BamD/ComL family)
LIALGENDSMGNTAVTSRKEHLAQGLNTFGKVYELLKGSKTTEEHDALWRFILFLRQNTNTHADAVVYTREFIKKFPRSVKYPWALRILVLDHLKKKEFDQAMKRYAEIKSMKGTERVLESLNGSFKFMGISIENGKFVKQGSTK